MKTISKESVLFMVSEINTKLKGISLVLDYLRVHQPHIETFTFSVMRGYDTGDGMSAAMLIWAACAAFEKEAGKPIPVCSKQLIDKHWQRNMDLFEFSKSNSLSNQKFMEVMQLEESIQPILMVTLKHFIIANFPSDHEEALKRVRAVVQIYLNVKTVVESLDELTEGEF